MEISYSIERARVPNASLKILVRLGKTLIRDQPKPFPAGLEHSLTRLTNQVAEVEAALIERFRETNPQVVASEADFDRVTDTAWVMLRRSLESWRDLGNHTGLSVMPSELQASGGVPELRKRADVAQRLHERLFGAEGTNWVMSSFIEQSQTMSTILGMIEADGLHDDLEFVVGPELPKLLASLQIHYEEMVSARMSRLAAPAENFRELRAKLRWWIDNYKSAVESLRDPADPKSFELVERALRSLILLSQKATQGGAVSEDDLLHEDLVELEDPAPTPSPAEALSA